MTLFEELMNDLTLIMNWVIDQLVTVCNNFGTEIVTINAKQNGLAPMSLLVVWCHFQSRPNLLFYSMTVHPLIFMIITITVLDKLSFMHSIMALNYWKDITWDSHVNLVLLYHRGMTLSCYVTKAVHFDLKKFKNQWFVVEKLCHKSKVSEHWTTHKHCWVCLNRAVKTRVVLTGQPSFIPHLVQFKAGKQ